MEDEAALVAAFMNSTGCGREDAFNRLASSGGHLGRALNSFFSSDAGPSSGSGRRRSRSPPPPSSLQVSLSNSEEDDDAVRARPPAPVPARRTRVSRWDSKTRVERRSKSSRRRERRRRCRRDDRPRESGTTDTPRGDRAADGNRSHRRRFREFREDIFSDGEEDEKTNSSSRRRRRLSPTELTSHSEDEKKAAADNNSRRRRLNPTELTSHSEDEKKADDNNENVIIDVSSDDGDNNDDDYMQALEEAARPARQPPPPHPRNRTFEELFKVPHSLTFKGGFHDAKVHAARRARWLLANVQSSEELPLPSLHQNRDVWGNALVAQCVRDRFVLWHADAATDDGEGEEEARKVLGYYDIPHDKLPVVVVVDPVTGQAMDVLHGSAACEFNDFMVRLGPFTDMKPTIPVAMAKRSTTSVSPGAQSSIRPATTTTAPTSSSERAAGSRQPAPTTTTVMRKPPDDAVVVAAAAAAPTCEARQEHAPTTTTTVTTEPVVAPCAGQQPETVEEKVCKVRVRLADGRVVTKEFGSQCAVAALFAYCRSMLGAGGAPPEKPFRLMRFVGRATEEIGDQNQNASFESLGLHLTTVSVHLG